MSQIHRVLALSLATCLLGACGAGEPTTTQPTVRWGVFKVYQPVFIAERLGFFAAEGVNVDLVGDFPNGQSLIQAVAAGEIDAGHTAISNIVNAVNIGLPIVGVADSQTEFRDAPLMRFFVRESSSIRAISDVRGKRIAVNALAGSFYQTWSYALDQNKLGVNDVTFEVIPHHNQEQALLGGQVDVAGVIDPYSNHLIRTGGVRELFRAVDVLGEVQFSLIFFRRDFVRDRQETVRKFLRGYRRAIECIYNEPERAASVMSAYLKLPEEVLGAHRYTPQARVRLEDVQFWLNLMRRTRELADGGKLVPNDIATTQFSEGVGP